MDNITIVLHRPRFPENIGAAARAMCNMGIERLVVVAPENFDLVRIERMATHAAAHVVRDMERCDELKAALGPFNYVVGTTARLGGERKAVLRPASLAANLIPISQENQVALVFGPEDRGLTNADIRRCHALVTIPTADFASLNLAQAVMIVCYTLFTSGETPVTDQTPRLANRHELDGMYAQLTDVLVRISYLNPENPDYWMNRMRQFFNRLPLRASEVSIIRGICRQINWYGRKCYQDGKEGKPKP